MSLLKRTARPFKRDSDTFRDDRLYIVASDDRYAPKQYFDFFRLKRIQIHVSPSEVASTAERVLDRLMKTDHRPEDELWLLLDTDHFTRERHLNSTMRALQKARKNKIKVAWSRPCFELWLLLHHIEESEVKNLPNGNSSVAALRKTLGEYNKTKLKAEHFPLSALPDACRRAQRLDKATGGSEIPQTNTSRIYLLWRSIVNNASTNQLPAELRDFSL